LISAEGLFALPLAVSCVNQTAVMSPVRSGQDLPFQIQIEQAGFSLPNGVHSGATAISNGQWLFIAGRTNGLPEVGHSTAFPLQQQNSIVYVVNQSTQEVFFRPLNDPSSGLSQTLIDILSVASPQYYQFENTLYMTGGYGLDSSTGQYSTKETLTAINVSGLMHWVTTPSQGESAAQYIRHTTHPIFQVTGGYMVKIGNQPTLLIFGQNFSGSYQDSSNSGYTEQVRRFRINDDGTNLSVDVLKAKPEIPNPNFRRRDLNVVPIMRSIYGRLIPGLVAFSGVFTANNGVWTVPVEIAENGSLSMSNPFHKDTFKQSMNNYACAHLGMFSQVQKETYTLLFGGTSFGYFANGEFQSDSELPFINQVTAIKLGKDGDYTQYLMNGSYPTILSTQSNAGNPLLFGAGAYFMPSSDLPSYDNGILKLDELGAAPVCLGYIVGGIASSKPNANGILDSTASQYIFKVTLLPSSN
jgi:hypothetical protein